MDLTLETIPTKKSLADLETVVRQSEAIGYTTVSLASGTIEGKRANLLTLKDAASATPVRLVIIDETKSLEAQRKDLRKAGATLVSFSAVYVDGKLANVAVVRD